MADKRTRMAVVVRPQAAASDTLEIEILDDIGKDFWTGEGVTAKTIRDALQGTKAKTVALFVNSGGGDAFEGVAIHNLLRAQAAKGARITASVLGLAASAASIIVAAADDVDVPSNASIMVHEASSGCWGSAADFEKRAALLRQINVAAADTYVESAGRRGVKTTREKMLALMADETWMFGQEAVDAGLADREAEALQAAAHVDVTAFRRAEEMRQRLATNRADEGQENPTMSDETITLHAQLAEAKAQAEQAKAAEAKAQADAAAAMELAATSAAEAAASAERVAALEASQAVTASLAADQASELNLHAVQALVGAKLYPGEVAAMARLRATDQKIFDELVAARPALAVLTNVTGADVPENAVVTDPDSKLAAIVRDA